MTDGPGRVEGGEHAQEPRPRMVLRSREFRSEREQGWQELESILAQIEAGRMSSLSPEQLERFPLLYRSAVSSLSVARSIALDRALVLYLENLSLRAFLRVYAPPIRIGAYLRRSLESSLPRAVRALRAHLVVALLTLLLGTGSGYAFVRGDPFRFSLLVPSGLAGGRGPQSTEAELRAVLSQGPSGIVETLDFVANALFTNNSLVALLMVGVGLLGGIPALLLLFKQGLMLGAFFALHHHHALAVEFSGWVFVHGVTELGAILLCAAAGLRFGELVVFPGSHTRAENLAIHGPGAARVAVGGLGMLVVAAILEGIFRQTIQSTGLRLGVAVASLLFWIVYFTFSGREEPA